MPKMRVHEVAKLLNKSSKEVITALKQQGVEVQSHMSTVTEENISKIKAAFHQKEQENTQDVAMPRTQENTGKAANEQMKGKEDGRQQGTTRTRHLPESNSRNERRSQSIADGVERNNRTDRSDGNRSRRSSDENRNTGNRSDGYRSDNSRNSDGSSHNTRNDNRGERRSRNSDGTRSDSRGENRSSRSNDGTRNENRRSENRSSRNSDGMRSDSRGENRSFRNNDGSRSDNRGENRSSRNSDGSRSYSNRNSDESRSYGNRGDSGSSNDGKRYGNRNSDGSRNYTNRNNDENRNYGSRSDGSRNSDTRYNNRNNDSGRNYNSRSNDGSRSYSSRNSDDNRSYNRGDSSRSDGGRGNDTGRKTRSKSMTSGDTPINAKESRSGNSRHDINREHSRENQNRGGENRDSRGGKNTRRNNNNTSRNNDYNNNNNQKRTKNKTKQTIVKTPKKEEPKEEVIRNITLPNPVSLKDLAEACKVTPAVIIKKLFLAGQMVTINTEFGFDEAADIALEYNCIAEEEVQVDIIEELLKEEEEDESTLVGRPPVVCVMGHVDHGKTSLLDAIRSTHVTEGEAGGITQHIGAYVVNINDEKITFLDTPGHEAFTSMRLRGAQATDIAVLVVAADDRVMPQTIEAINHAKAAEVEVIVAVNKIDKEGANVERVKQELTEYGLIAEDWGGSTVFVPISAKTGEGIQDLLEMISLTAEVLELKANPKRKARGLVIEAKLDKGRGPVATVLIQKGTLHVGDNVNIGHTFGRIRAMIDDKGNRVKTAGPSMPVEILGLNDVPFSGEVMMAHDSEKEARTTAEAFVAYSREKMLEDTKSKLSLDDLFDQIQAGNVKELNLVVKADVQGSVEAVRQSLMKLSNDEVVIKVIHGGVGAINESDVTLASASNAIIIGFNVRPDATAKSVAEREKVDMRLYRVIYNAIEDIEAAIKGMLDPVFQEKIIGHLDVRQIYKASGVGTIAGCYVLDGMITRSAQVRIVRDGIVIYEGLLASLKRFKDDVKEVKSGFECGLVFEKFNDVKEGDQVEAFVMEEIPR